MHVWAQREWHNGMDSFRDSIRKVNNSLAILMEGARGQEKYRRERKPVILINKTTRKAINAQRPGIWQKILQEAAIWYNPNLGMETWESVG